MQSKEALYGMAFFEKMITSYQTGPSSICNQNQNDITSCCKHHKLPFHGLYFPASVASSTFISSLLPLKPLILVGVAPVAG